MILLQKLQIKDFLSHESTEITFQENEKLLLDGQSGAGKSSILDAILWALYGVSRSENRSLVRKTAGKATVTLVLSNNKDRGYNKITRSVTSEGKHSLSIDVSTNGTEYTASKISGIRELQNFIEKDLIGASYLLFVNSVAYIQGGMDTFVTQTANKRKDLLLELLGNLDLSKLYENTKVKLSSISTDKAALGGGMEAQRAYIKQAKEQVEKDSSENNEVILNALQEEAKAIEVSLKETEERIRVINENTQKGNRLEKDISVMRDTEKALLSVIASNKRELADSEQLSSRIVELNKIIEGKPAHEEKLKVIRALLVENQEKANKRLAFLSDKPQLRDFESDISSIQARYDLQKKSVPSCPSGDACPYMGRQNDSLKMYEDQITLLTEQKTAQDFAMTDWARKYDEFPIPKPMEEENKELVDLSNLISACVSAEKEKSAIETILARRDSTVTVLAQHQKQLAELVEKIEDAQETLATMLFFIPDPYTIEQLTKTKTALGLDESNINRKISYTTAVLSSLEKRKEEISTREIEISASYIKFQELERQEKLLLKLKEAFGNNGIKATVVDYILPKLENDVNDILSKLSDFTVRLDTKKLKADGEGSSEGLYITVTNPEGEALPYEGLSGGEKVKVTTAFAEAFASLGHCGFRLLDENVSALDQDSLEGFMHTIIHLQQKYPQVIAISHIQQIKDLFEKTITITKHHGISTIT